MSAFGRGPLIAVAAMSAVYSLLTSNLLVSKSVQVDPIWGGATMHETEHRSFGQPDQTREFPNGKAEILNVGGGEVGRLIFQPGGVGRTM